MSIANIAGAAAAALAAGMYLDGRFLVRNDLRQGSRKLNMLMGQRYLTQRVHEQKLTIYDTLEDRARSPEGKRLCLIFEGQQWTYTEFYEALQPIGNWLMKDLGVKKGEVVAIDGGNTPEYVMLIFALEAIGAAPALLNSNLTADPLIHSAKVASARYLLADEQVRNLVSPAEEELAKEGITTVYYGPDFIKELKDTETLPKDRRLGLDPLGLACLLYTSGTTGLPKGVVQPRSRLLIGSVAIGRYLKLKPGDRMYTCLPLYHATALGLCVMPCLYGGFTVVLGRKFSHSAFWPEVHESGATHFQYVGELCRYLVNAPPSPLDRGHKVRMAWGNGMRPEVWERFRERFGIECINELYGASDGMLMTMNPNRGDFSRDAIAVRGPLWHVLNRDEKRILVDPDTQELVRGQDGWAVEAKPNEVGEIIVRMDTTNPDRGTPQYFKNRKATNNRRVADVFQKGDLWFRSGDLFRQDRDGRLFFIDRLGDTFRWRSENVSTHEVGSVLGEFPQVAETNVYGVLVPHAEGRAGCAAIVPTDDILQKEGSEIDFKALAAHCRARLPRYAVPLFLRVARRLDYTGTHKLQKQKLRTEGVDLAAIQDSASEDRMFWLPPGEEGYVLFTEKDLEGLKAGRVRL
ncbi:fatty-acyl-CoA synthase [Xylaria sp. CBS 124048]|nr:fatty-acyl-CoA synthase [Xylaria sp. CBS 124048]